MKKTKTIRPSGVDDQVPIQNAINNVASNGGTISLPCGWWKDGRPATPEEIQEIEKQLASWRVVALPLC